MLIHLSKFVFRGSIIRLHAIIKMDFHSQISQRKKFARIFFARKKFTHVFPLQKNPPKYLLSQKKMTVLNKRLLLLLLIVRRRFLFRKKKAKIRRFWVWKIFTERKQIGEFYRLVQDLKLLDSDYFFKQFRMTPRKLEELLAAPRILQSNVKRETISPEERLWVTLRYVVTGDAHVTIAASYRISPTSISRRTMKVTTKVTWNVFLNKGFLKVPNSAQKWKKITQSFESKWNFPHCLGAIFKGRGKHIIMQGPAKSDSLFYNCKSFSILFC